jgi:plastocyanin
MMKLGLTASLVVCLMAAGLAVGALAIRPGTEPEPPQQVVVTVPEPGSSPYGEETSSGETPAAVAQLTIAGFEFSSVTVAPGATVTVVNQDGFPHTVTAEDGSFDSGTVDGGTTGSFVAPATPGTYQFLCNFHPQMSGTLTVG